MVPEEILSYPAKVLTQDVRLHEWWLKNTGKSQSLQSQELTVKMDDKAQLEEEEEQGGQSLAREEVRSFTVPG